MWKETPNIQMSDKGAYDMIQTGVVFQGVIHYRDLRALVLSSYTEQWGGGFGGGVIEKMIKVATY